MMMPQASLFPACKRGLFGLSSWEPQRKPGSNQQRKVVTQPQQNGSAGHRQPSPQDTRTEDTRPEITGKPPKNAKKLIAKYSYTANPDSPLGDEVTMKQGDVLTLVSDVNQVWWLVQDGRGHTAYAPASYLMEQENKPDGLPWLQNKEPEQKAQTQPQSQQPMTTTFGRPSTYNSAAAKPYQSAYNRDQAADSKKYYCEICDKTLNGPKPYNSHMNSKAHREEVEYAQSMGRC